jgi:UPF0716 family protein affecting phage T7 exclusion
MKEFAVYTGLRLVLFAACFGLLWVTLQNWLGIFPLLLLALVLSSILSIFVLRAAREQRAARMSSRIEAARKAEDED